MYSLFSTLLIVCGSLFLLATILLGIYNQSGKKWSETKEMMIICITSAVAIYVTLLSNPDALVIALNASACLGLVLVLCWLYFPYHSLIGLFFYVTNIILAIIGLVWGFLFVFMIDVSFVTRLLILITSPLLILTLPFGFVLMIEQFDVLCRKYWLRPRYKKESTLNRALKVSLHIPVYAEPPLMVIETLNALAAIEYGNFEVVVVDNNTSDESLWKPIELHCKKLGRKFKFFHVESLAGAKAGALNFALEKTAPDAEIIGVVDADYQAHPHFIRDLIGHFEDPKIGFVQTPHDYRDWEDSLYLQMCYWEYKAFFHTTLVSLNERDTALTIGTMCLLRKQAIIDAGGWATWCVTEDSELSIRIHDKGYSSVYIPVSYGKGLIPLRFSDYATQRYRWISGPVQELKHHFLRYIGFGKRSSLLTKLQRLHHFHHGFGSASFGLNIPFIFLAIALAISMTFHREIIPVPFALWMFVTILLITNIALSWLQYRVILGVSFKEMLMGMLANKALTHTVNTASLSTILNSQQKWLRTNKFKVKQDVVSVLASTGLETGMGLMLFVFAVTIYITIPFQGLLTMCLLGIVYKSFDYLATPIVALIAMRSQEKQYQYGINQHSRSMLEHTRRLMW